MILSTTPISSIELDPQLRIADVDMSNNRYPQEIQRSRLELYRSSNQGRNLMADLLVELQEAETGEDAEPGNEVPLEPNTE